ncbi:transmembrane protein 68 [Holotrichia oblita]|uniref:Transmembrane protein 68 n=1 Tax=Holotrichia oblita TaxID=644536 RepID=A0ACB9TNE1_HOLOL|nr:transmembrane protein 68 [Holotrichia oblita]
MADYSFEEMSDMHLMYGLAHCKRTEARRFYADHFPNRCLPNEKTFERLHIRLRETESFKPVVRDRGRPRTTRTLDLEERVLDRVEENAGFAIIAESMKVIPGTIQSCANVLKEGNLLAIAPGGVYESQFSHNYNLMWKKRLGFAKVALEAKVPIIPMFTENVREAFRTVSIGRKFFLKLYALTKFPFTPIYGGFPVKMITHIGKPINYDPSLTPEKLQEKVLKTN